MQKCLLREIMSVFKLGYFALIIRKRPMMLRKKGSFLKPIHCVSLNMYSSEILEIISFEKVILGPPQKKGHILKYVFCVSRLTVFCYSIQRTLFTQNVRTNNVRLQKNENNWIFIETTILILKMLCFIVIQNFIFNFFPFVVSASNQRPFSEELRSANIK